MLNTNLTPPPYTSSSQQRSGGLLGDALAVTRQALHQENASLGRKAVQAIRDTFNPTKIAEGAEQRGMKAVSDLLTPEEQVAFEKATLESKALATKALGNKKALAIKAKEEARKLAQDAKNQAELKKVQAKIKALQEQETALQASKPEKSVDPIFNFTLTQAKLDAVQEQAEKMVKLFGR
ncbi:MAG: hypothetical protein ACK5T0_07895 [Vampirovibrionales bacterium]